MKHFYEPDVIVIDKNYQDSIIVQNVLRYFPQKEKIWIDSASQEREYISSNLARRIFSLSEHKGRFFKDCQGCVASNVRCDYFTINLTQNCHFACSYCFLQDYMNRHTMTQFVNLPDLFSQLDQAFAAKPNQFFRVGTGELADSLGLDPITGLAPELIKYFSQKTNAALELKTKSAFVDGLLNLPHRNTYISWSVGAELIAQQEELKTANISERVEAAAKVANAGYGVAFHFDPLIYFEGWEKEYERTWDLILKHVPIKNILYFSLGSLRFKPAQRHSMREYFPKTNLLKGELLMAPDDKMRYPESIRVEQYQFMKNLMDRDVPQIPKYLCMEFPQVFEKVFPGISPMSVQAEMGRVVREFFKKG
jgi:spore photoproduct lyase